MEAISPLPEQPAVVAGTGKGRGRGQSECWTLVAQDQQTNPPLATVTSKMDAFK